MLLAYPADADLGAAAWIDLRGPTDDEIARVEAATGIRVPDEHEISEIEATSRLAFENGAFRVSTPLVGPGENGLVLTPLGLVLSARVLLSVSFGPLPSLHAAYQNFGAQPGRTAEEAFLRILEVVVDRIADKLEHAGSGCDELSRVTFGGGKNNRIPANLRVTLAHIGRVAEDVSRIRDALLGLGRVAAYVMESGIDGAPPVNPARMKAVRSDIASLTEYQGHLSSKVQFLLDATLGFINIEQNEIVKILTIASVVGIPPVLVAGIYGMNFHDMPELGWRYGYPMALGVIVASALLPLVWFKRRQWM
jgi:magnesium transporter